MRYINVSASCHIGNIRDYNEDMILVADKFIRDNSLDMNLSLLDSNRFVIALADGLGGYNSGDIASAETLSNLKFFIDDLPDLLTTDGLKDLLNNWLGSINQIVSSQGYVNPRLSKMGTTLVGIIFYGNKFFWMNCGDSRLYRLRNDEIVQISTDHSSSVIDTDNPVRGVTNCIGGGCRTSYLDINEFTDIIEDGDIYVLCSDGLSDMLSDAEIRRILMRGGNADVLSAVAIAAGGYDNVSVCVMKIV